MAKSVNELYTELKNNEEVFLKYLHEQYPVVYKSNIFLRDIQYAIKHYFEMKDVKVGYDEVDQIASKFIDSMVSEKKLLPIDHKTWVVNFELEKKEPEKEPATVEN